MVLLHVKHFSSLPGAGVEIPDLLVVEANHGRLLPINLTRWQDPIIEQLLGHILPTSVTNRDNRFYVGNLGRFPITVGLEKLYQVTHDGFVIDYWDGFTTILDVRGDDDGRLYVEFSSSAGFPAPGNGRILRFANPISGTVVTSIKIRKPAPPRDHDHDDDDR